ncbi:hypothetical protein [Chryseobacterium salviniae]|uniref:Uncharacterized protein n=1 Tax=Chryseobacterium salviniae TaxID=3101750 RepID=A0ABU6HUK7_9FLAO|nr:hypothetical protein [Chryseobacterium sp. T9W2-O]MEC3876356.1 hypothetical protein [Chryseobacterium sp. T9W2-O]
MLKPEIASGFVFYLLCGGSGGLGGAGGRGRHEESAANKANASNILDKFFIKTVFVIDN